MSEYEKEDGDVPEW